MTLKDQLMEDLKDAMKSGDELRKTTIRMTRAAIRSAEMARMEEIFGALDKDRPAPKGVSPELFAEIKKRRAEAAQYETTTHGEAPDPENDAMSRKIRSEIGAQVEDMSTADDARVQEVIQKEIKQRHDAAEEYTRGGRPELAEKEMAEAVILAKYLPSQMSEGEIESEVRAIAAEVGASGPADMKKVMPVAMQRLKGRADGRLVNSVVTRVLSN